MLLTFLRCSAWDLLSDGLLEEAACRVQQQFQRQTGIPVPPSSRIEDCRQAFASMRAHMHDNQDTPKRVRRSTMPVPGQHFPIVVPLGYMQFGACDLLPPFAGALLQQLG